MASPELPLSIPTSGLPFSSSSFSIPTCLSPVLPFLCCTPQLFPPSVWAAARCGCAGGQGGCHGRAIWLAGGRHDNLSQAPKDANIMVSPGHLAGQTNCLIGQVRPASHMLFKSGREHFPAPSVCLFVAGFKKQHAAALPPLP